MIRSSVVALLTVALTSWAVPAVAAVAPARGADPVTTAEAPAPRQPQQESGTVSRPYSQNWVFRSTKLNRCAFIAVSGQMTGRWRKAYGPDSPDNDTLEWKRIRLKNPSITAQAWPISGAGCDSTKRWNMKATLSQGFFQSGCDLSVSVGAGFPWSVSATPAYSCSTGRVGHRSSTEGRSRKTLAQYNSGAPIRFSPVLASRRAGGVGFSGVISARIFTRNASDLARYTINVTLNR